jgi:hypothetical protein
MHVTGLARGKIILPDLTVVTYNEPALREMFAFHDKRLEEFARIARRYGMRMALTYMTAAVASAQVQCITTTGLYMSIHTATPGNTGASEIPNNSASGYTQSVRPTIAWGSITNGVVSSNDTQTYTMGASWTPGSIPYFGLWTASTSGTFLFGGPTSGLSGSIPVAANVTFTSAVTLTAAG